MSILSSELRSVLRRLKPERHLHLLRPRDISKLSFLDRSQQMPAKLLYDTTVYIDILQNRFSINADLVFRAADGWHTPPTEAELVASCGLLDPAHPNTRDIVKQVINVIERRPLHRTIVPDREAWMEAALLSGILARLQGYSRPDRYRTLVDALLFATAKKHGLTVLTRNRIDFDFLQQLAP